MLLKPPRLFSPAAKTDLYSWEALESVSREGSHSGFLVELPLTENGQSRGGKTPQKAAAVISESGWRRPQRRACLKVNTQVQ